MVILEDGHRNCRAAAYFQPDYPQKAWKEVVVTRAERIVDLRRMSSKHPPRAMRGPDCRENGKDETQQSTLSAADTDMRIQLDCSISF
jgi:hypothetical protein